ncbi:hypothetical protein HanIR_Chr06g0295361 [Helianthus annuus]|nr:hypothetical protein HanIR_Chr06g0295361 [Helianthus annuus]
MFFVRSTFKTIDLGVRQEKSNRRRAAVEKILRRVPVIIEGGDRRTLDVQVCDVLIEERSESQVTGTKEAVGILVKKKSKLLLKRFGEGIDWIKKKG